MSAGISPKCSPLRSSHLAYCNWGPMVRIHLPPAASQMRTCLSREFAFLRREAAVFRGCAGGGERVEPAIAHLCAKRGAPHGPSSERYFVLKHIFGRYCSTRQRKVRDDEQVEDIVAVHE